MYLYFYLFILKKVTQTIKLFFLSQMITEHDEMQLQNWLINLIKQLEKSCRGF